MVVAVKTHYNHYSQRQAIRKSWGGIRLLNGVRIYVIYVIGRGESSKDVESLMMESRKYGDLLQLKMNETYQ